MSKPTKNGQNTWTGISKRSMSSQQSFGQMLNSTEGQKNTNKDIYAL